MILSIIFFIQIVITIAFTVLAAIYDVKDNIVPGLLTYIMILVGIGLNGLLSFVSHDAKYILASIISTLITFAITYMLWQLNMWGGGDVMLFTGIASLIPIGINVDFLNIFPEMSVYPFSFTVIINSILVSFPFLVIFVTYLIFKSRIFKNSGDFLLNIFNADSLKYLKDIILNADVSVDDLKEGMIINEYYYNNEWVSTLIRDLDGNLKVYKNNSDDEFKYYFKSQSAGGITPQDVVLLKVMHVQGFIKDNLRRKLSFPFTPAILFGLLIAVVYGDMMMLFTKNIILVV